MKQKNSQVTIFLVLSMIIVIMIAILAVVSRYSTKKASRQEIIDAKEIVFDVHPIKNFVDECLSMVSKDGLNKTKPLIEEKLEEFVKNNIKSCLDFSVSVFEQQGFYISKEDAIIDVSINENDVVFMMSYPIIISNHVSHEKTKIENFLVKHKTVQEEI